MHAEGGESSQNLATGTTLEQTRKPRQLACRAGVINRGRHVKSKLKRTKGTEAKKGGRAGSREEKRRILSSPPPPLF